MKGHLIIVALCISFLLVAAVAGNSKSVIVAEAEGKRGSIRVEERNGMRFLTIDNVVQGGMPVGLDSSQRFIDPMVELIRAVRPEAGTALVIGLGTGKTAGDLSSVGFSVETVELEPVVIDFARRYFDYKGRVVEADGLEYLKKTKNHYDIILMDAFSGGEPPAHLVNREAFTLMRRRLSSKNGLLAVRLLARPDDLEVTKMLQQYGTMIMNYKQMFGSGFGSEKQNLYILVSSRALNIEKTPAGLPLPVTTCSGELLPGRRRSILGNQSRIIGTRNGTQSRKILVLGYLIRAKETGDICIDLPHCDMGAVRYLIRGDALPELNDLVKENTSFPTAGDIPSDGDRSETLRMLLGGGGAKRNEVRFSRVLVAVEGNACLRSLIDPDLAYKGKGPNEALLPYGGILYELEVSKVLMSLDYRSWEKFRREKLKPIINRAVDAFAASDIEKAAAAIGDYLEAMDSRLNGFGSKCRAYNDMAKFKWVLDFEKAKIGKQASAFEIAAACDWAKRFVGGVEDAKIVRRVIRECAERNYAKVASNPKDPNALKAAARLSYLLMERSNELKKAAARLSHLLMERSDELKTQADMLERRVSELKILYKGIEPANRTPGGEERVKELEKHFQKE